MRKLTEKDEILLKIAQSCKEFKEVDTNNRVLQSFYLGMMYNQLDVGETYISTLSRVNEILGELLDDDMIKKGKMRDITVSLRELVRSTLGIKK